jgi:hypothetical protein
MKMLTLQYSLEDLARSRGEPRFLNIESLQVLNFLKQEQNEFAMICILSHRGPVPKIEDFFREKGKIQLIERKRGVCTYFIKMKPHPDILDGGGYLVEPFQVRDGIATITFFGTSREVRRFLQKARTAGFPYKVVSIKNANFSSDSPVNHLTDKQRDVLVAAYRLGYYDIPKKTSSRKLAEKLNIRSSTLITHRIKAERHLLDEILLDYLLKQS